MAALLIALGSSSAVWAQDDAQQFGRDESYVIFVSQRNGAAELYLLELKSRQVSQLTKTGRGHLTPSIASNRAIVFAARTGANYELFSGELGSSWRSRRPTIVGLNRLTTDTEDQLSPSVAREGGWLAFQSGAGIELMTTRGAGQQLLIPTATEYQDFGPAVSPDGKQVAFISNRTGAYEIWLFTRAGNELRQLTRGGDALGGLQWSADGKRLAFTTKATNSGLSGIALAETESGSVRVLTESNDYNASLSARGDRIIFTSMRDGDADLYLLNLNTNAIERLTSNAGLDDGAVFVAEPTRPNRLTR
jgi:TolB protein